MKAGEDPIFFEPDDAIREGFRIKDNKIPSLESK